MGDFKGAYEASKNCREDEKWDIKEIFGDVVSDAYDAKDYEKTIELAPKAVEIGASAHYLKYAGEAAFHLKRYELCITFWEEFVEDYLKGSAFYAYYKEDLGYILGVAYEATGNNAKAYEYYKAFISGKKKYEKEEWAHSKKKVKELGALLGIK